MTCPAQYDISARGDGDEVGVHIYHMITTYRLPLSFETATEISLSNEPEHKISNNVVCATSKASNQPAHMRSLIRAFASHLSIT